MLYLFSPNLSLAVICYGVENYLQLCYPEMGGFRLTLNIDINKLVAWFYYFIVSIAGLAAFIMLVWAGFEWLTSVGDPAKISSAKDRIFSAFLGLVIILASYLILQVINPDLIMLNLPDLRLLP